jgi:predicted DNA binding CopG/RHH family protein
VARQLIAIRIDPQVLTALQREANRRGVGYQTLIHQLLARYVARRRSA